MAIQLQLRRGTSDKWLLANPVLAEAEMGLELDTLQFKIGDGVTAWADLEYGGIRGPQGSIGPTGLQGPQGPAGLAVPATSTTIGGVIIGNGISVAEDGTISVDTSGLTVDLSGNLAQDFQAKQLTVAGLILPSGVGQDIGTPTQRFRAIYVDEAHLSTNTLYLGDTPILGTTSNTVNINTDPNQHLTVKTTGTGLTSLTSETGVTVHSNGVNAVVNVESCGVGSSTNISGTQQVNVSAPNVKFTGTTDVVGALSADSLVIRGTVTLQGQTFTVDATNMTVTDNIIEINNGQVGAGVTAGIAGLRVNRGDLPDYLVVFDETDDILKIGANGSLEIVATRPWVTTYSETPAGAQGKADNALAAAKAYTDSVPKPSRVVNFCITGPATTGTNKITMLADKAYTIQKVKIYSDTAPTGADLIVDLKKNGVTIFTNQANRPTITAGATVGADRTNMDVTTLIEGDRLSLDIAQVGSTVAGGNNLTVLVIIA